MPHSCRSSWAAPLRALPLAAEHREPQGFRHPPSPGCPPGGAASSAPQPSSTAAPPRARLPGRAGSFCSREREDRGERKEEGRTGRPPGNSAAQRPSPTPPEKLGGPILQGRLPLGISARRGLWRGEDPSPQDVGQAHIDLREDDDEDEVHHRSCEAGDA
ncbi:hypothetical protein P7K49_013230 [Saguinus oedipus]|uniref:Uncharacterized protein n=1 Tax=Saguinus oedipus TaxID=9490 RepID=A0ABQ9VFA7_SAGOE|nr:hypothetical protein P7K49_013230 [Saguinus oedipus]